MIDWSTLSKEKKQYIAFGVIGSVALIYVLFTVLSGVSSPEKKDGNEVNIDLEELEADVDNAERTIRKERQILTQYDECLADLVQKKEQYFPNEGNRYAWVTELIYSQSRKYDVEVAQICELGRGKSEEEPFFNRYSVQVILNCNYEKALDFTKFFETSNPLIKIISLQINSVKEHSLNHVVTLVMEWPTSMDIQDIQRK